MEAVYVQTNDAQKNEIVAYRRESDGSLSKIGSFETGGKRDREAPSPVTELHRPERRRSLVAGRERRQRHDLAVRRRPRGLRLADTARRAVGRPRASASTGHSSTSRTTPMPTSPGSRSPATSSTRLAGSTTAAQWRRRRSRSDQLQSGRKDARRHRARLELDQRLRNRRSGLSPDGPSTIASAGETPYGFDFTSDRDARRHGGVRRREGKSRGVVLRAHGARPAEPGERVRRRHTQRSLLGRRREGRPFRLRHELR